MHLTTSLIPGYPQRELGLWVSLASEKERRVLLYEENDTSKDGFAVPVLVVNLLVGWLEGLFTSTDVSLMAQFPNTIESTC